MCNRLPCAALFGSPIKVTPAAPDIEQIANPAKVLTTLRNNSRMIHCLTNSAAAAFSADVLLALGAHPSLTHAPAEVEGFARSADALLVNLGTLDAERISGLSLAVKVMNSRHAPWVLDPVLCNRSTLRRELALELLQQGPAILRLNINELQSLTGHDDPESAHQLARDHNCIVVLTGKLDLVTDGQTAVQLTGGHEYMDIGTAYGCAGGAVTAACTAACATLDLTPFDAALSSLMIFNLAGAITGRIAGGPGSFRPIFLDTLHMLEADDLSSINFTITELST